MIIGLVAQKRQGKDTMADHLVKQGEFKRYAFADSLKESCKMIFCLNDRQVDGDLKEVLDERWGMSPREMFISVGIDLFRESLPSINPSFGKKIGQDIWLRRFQFWYEKWSKENPGKHVVISDVRFMNEYKKLKSMGAVIVGIKGKVHLDKTTISEMLINTCECDHYIENKGTLPEYYEKIDKLMEKL